MSAQALPYWRLSGFYFFYFALLGATAPFLGLYFAHLGFAPERIGELVAIPMLMRCVAPNLWGWLGDRSGRRLAIVRLGACCTLASFALILFDKGYAWLALVMALHAFFWHAVLPQFEVITLAHLRERAARYSQVRLWGSIGFIASVVVLGWAFQHFGLDAYPFVLLGVMAGIVAAAFGVPDAQPPDAASRFAGGFLAQLRQPGVMVFYVAVALMQLSHGPYYTFLSIHLEALGYSRALIGQLWALGVLAEILLFLGMARVLARFSVVQVLLACFLIAALRWWLLGSFAEHLAILLFAQVLHAATFGAFHAASIHFIQRSFGARQQGQGQALYAALAGIGGALGALYSGYAWQWLGAAWTFALASLSALLAAALLARQLRRLPSRSVADAREGPP